MIQEQESAYPPHVIGNGQLRSGLPEIMRWYAQTRTIEERLHEIGDCKEPARTIPLERDR